MIATSTPSPWLTAIARDFGVDLAEHEHCRGIASDWNFALAQAPDDADWLTIAHQDDVYAPRFVEATMAALNRAPDALLAFTDYVELMPAGERSGTLLLGIKKFLLELGFKGRSTIQGRNARRMCLRFGSPIPCPSVTLRRSLEVRFDDSYGVGLDWAAWLDLCERPGSFVWVREPLMAHRIHVDSETTQAIAGGKRAQEDERILRRLWPGWIARMIVRSYRLAYASNRT